MTVVVSDEEQLRINVRPKLRERMDAVFETQGVTMKVGLTRLIEFLVDAPEEVRPLILGQVPGYAKDVLLAAVLAKLQERDGQSVRPAGAATPAATADQARLSGASTSPGSSRLASPESEPIVVTTEGVNLPKAGRAGRRRE